MPKPDAGPRHAGIEHVKGCEPDKSTDGVHVCACTCVSTGSHRVQQEEGRAGLVTERSDVPGIRRLGNCVGNPQCLLVNLDWKPLRLQAEIQFCTKSHSLSCFYNTLILTTQPYYIETISNSAYITC